MPHNFFYNICTDAQYGFKEYHATTMGNPLLPKRLQSEGIEEWLARRDRFQAELIRDNDPLVYAQEYLAEFIDWSGVAFFGRDKLLNDGMPATSGPTTPTLSPRRAETALLTAGRSRRANCPPG